MKTPSKAHAGAPARPLRGKKTWREKLQDDKGLPKVGPIDGRIAVGRKEGTMVIPAPREVDALMRRVRRGKLTTIDDLRAALAAAHGVTVACPITTGIFAWLAAHAADEASAAGEIRITPYWRTLKSRGEVNSKYPGGLPAAAARLEAEGHAVFQKGKRAFVRDFERSLARLAVVALAAILHATAAFAQADPAPAANEKIGGVGMVLIDQAGNIVVGSVLQDSPAYGSKLIHKGDRILGIAEGEQPPQLFKGKTLSEAVSKLRGTVGSHARLLLVSEGAEESDAREVLITREPLNQMPVLRPDEDDAPQADPPADPAAGPPALVFSRLPGGEPDQLSNYRGKFVVLAFWATWSGPSQAAMADLQAVAARWNPLRDKVAFITVSMDRAKEAPAARLMEKGWSDTLNAWAAREALAPWRIHGLPETCVIGPDGRIMAENPRMTRQMLEDLLPLKN